jgi:hypothetical protein
VFLNISFHIITQLYVYFANNVLAQNLGNDIQQLNIPQTQATITPVGDTYILSFSAGFKNLGNNYVYLTYNKISNTTPYGSRPVNFLVNPTNPIITTNIVGVTGILSQYVSIIGQSTTFTVTLGDFFESYYNDGVTKLYIYTKKTTDSSIYTNYKPINNLSGQTYPITLVNGVYQVTFTTSFSNISQLYVYLTFNQISRIYNYGEGLVNIQITNPTGAIGNWRSQSLMTYKNIWSKFQIEIVSETDAFSNWWFTEKTARCLATGKPFLLLAGTGSLGYLRKMGFETYNSVIDESYDLAKTPTERINKIVECLLELYQSADKDQRIQDLNSIAQRNIEAYQNYNLLCKSRYY